MGIQREVAVTMGTVRHPASGATRTVLVLDPDLLTVVEGAIRRGAWCSTAAEVPFNLLLIALPKPGVAGEADDPAAPQVSLLDWEWIIQPPDE